MSSFFIAVVVLAIVLKIWFKLSIGRDKSATCLVGKTVIVTGANSGIGFYVARDFAKRGARVILACRDKTRAEKARTKLIQATGNSNIVVRIIDFASFASVRAFAKEILNTEPKLDILVNNAGVGSVGDATTSDGLNLLMQTNHFGPFLHTLLLIDLLKRSAPSRIINMASIMSWTSNLDLNNLGGYPNSPWPLSELFNYSNSKLCNMLFANELARRLKESGVVVNSVHPGFIDTPIFYKVPLLLQLAMPVLMSTIFRTAEEGAQTPVYAAVSKEIEGVSGEYFDNCRIGWFPGMPKIARDERLAKQLWKKTEELVKLTKTDPQI